jgi:hypothetical protein
MSIVNVNGQPTTPTGEPNPAVAPRTSLTPAEAQQIIGAYAKLKQLNANAISNPRDDAEKAGLINFLHGALLAHAEEFFGCWVAINQEYTPLITGFTALLQRALTRIDYQNAANRAQATEEVAKTA